MTDLGKYAADVAGPGSRKRLNREKGAAWVQKHHLEFKCIRFTLSQDTDKGLISITEGSVPKGTPDEALGRVISDMLSDFDYVSGEAADMGAKDVRFWIGGCVKIDPLIPPIYQWPFLVSPSPESEARARQHEGQETNFAAAFGAMQRLLDKVSTLHNANMQQEKTELREEKKELLEFSRVLLSEKYQQTKDLQDSLDNRSMRDVTALEKRVHLDMLLDGYRALKEVGEKLVQQRLGIAPGQDALKAFAAIVDPMKLLSFMAELSPAEREKFKPVGARLLDLMPEDKRQALGQMFAARAAAEGAPLVSQLDGAGAKNGAAS